MMTQKSEHNARKNVRQDSGHLEKGLRRSHGALTNENVLIQYTDHRMSMCTLRILQFSNVHEYLRILNLTFVGSFYEFATNIRNNCTKLSQYTQ